MSSAVHANNNCYRNNLIGLPKVYENDVIRKAGTDSVTEGHGPYFAKKKILEYSKSSEEVK